jgi:heme exporter protein A
MKLIADQVSVRRDSRSIFAGLSFTVEAGSSLILRGPNGAGKTTLLRVIAGLLPASAGRLRVEGGPAETSLSELCHYVGHLNAVKPALTVEENARFWQRFLGGGGEHVDVALAAFGLAGLSDIPAAYLSAGQKRRLALARVLLAPRAIWLLDEPAAALDQDAEAALSAAVTARLAGGGLVVAATHQPLNWPNARVLRLTPSARVP